MPTFNNAWVRDKGCVVAVAPCRCVEATSRHRASINASSEAVLFAFSGFFLSCSRFLASRIQCGVGKKSVLNRVRRIAFGRVFRYLCSVTCDP
jgi:hypothetical protein